MKTVKYKNQPYSNKNRKRKKISWDKIEKIRLAINRGYASPSQIAKVFKVTKHDVFFISDTLPKAKKKRKKFNGISYAHYKVMCQLFGNVRAVAELANIPESTMYNCISNQYNFYRVRR